MGSNNRLKFDGLEELRASLRRLPKDLRDDAEGIVFESAEAAADEIRAAYFEKTGFDATGELSDKVVVQQLKGAGTAFAGALVQNKSKLAFIYENGTQVRHNDLGANRGAMPPGHVFVPRVIKWRKTMYEKLRDMMRSHGLKVSG